jgi:hypothetical protein
MAKKENKVEEPIVEKTEEVKDDNVTKVKIKTKPIEDDVVKVDLTKPPVQQSEEVEKQPAKEEEVVVVNPEPEAKVEEEVKEEVVEEEAPVVQEVTDEEVQQVEEEIEEAVQEAEATGKPLPENVQKLVDFMDETGGDINDYVNLNRDVSKMDDSDVLDEYYRTTKSHLTAEERSFLLEDNFGYDEETDDPNYIRKKKIALKEQVAEARSHLDGQKSKYYEDIKAGSKLTSEQQKAIDFFSRYNKESEETKKQNEASKKTFLKKTNSIFDKNFKGFDYEVGDKKFRFNVKDADKVKTTQSDLNNFINKFTDKDGSTIEDARGYHKSLFTAMNADAIAKHFYEQGKADAIKGQVAKDKNINLDPRQTHGETNVGGVKYKVLGDSTDDFKLRIKKRK